MRSLLHAGRPGYFGSLRIHATIASTTAAGCSGMRAWLASGITAIVTRPPSSSLSSFIVSRGLKGSSAAWRSSKGALPAPHHSSCRVARPAANRSEEHTSELQSQSNLVCRLLLEKKKKNTNEHLHQTSKRNECSA